MKQPFSVGQEHKKCTTVVQDQKCLFQRQFGNINQNNFYPLHSGIPFLGIMYKFTHKLTDIKTSTFIIILFTVAKYWTYQCSETVLKKISDIHVVENHATSQQ